MSLKNKSKIAAVVLAAGKGTRMKSDVPKVLHQVCGSPMIGYALDLLRQVRAQKVVVVVGHASELVRGSLAEEPVDFVTQSPQHGTGHALMCAMPELKGFDGDVLVLSGDVPLITKDTLKGLISAKRDGGKDCAMSLVTTVVADPTGYGRVLRDDDGCVSRVVEHKDASFAEKEIKEINAGIYLISSRFLHDNIRKLKNSNAQGEYYLPDLIAIAASSGKKVEPFVCRDSDEVMGVNNRMELARANAIVRSRILNELMLSGVTIVDPANTYVDKGVAIGVDSIIEPGVFLLGDTTIGKGCVIAQGSRIESSRIGDKAHIRSHSIIENSTVGKDAIIGPFARVRPGCSVGENAHVGNFVELKKTKLGKGSKANHLSYLGDSVIGKGVNIGAGAITCNYDGIKKHVTTIKDNAFIGSDSQLVAPVCIGKGAYVGSGTTVTKDVPAWSLVVTRAPEKVVKDWAKKRRDKK